jgi:hypothetical protein
MHFFIFLTLLLDKVQFLIWNMFVFCFNLAKAWEFKKKMDYVKVSILKIEWSSIVHNNIFVQSILSKLIWKKIVEFYIIKCYKIIKRIHGLFDWEN